MGIIQRQGIKHSIVNMAGLVVATLSTVLLYSQQEVVEAYGLVQYFLSIAVIGYPLFSLAAGSVAIRFFPNFEDKTKGHNGLLSLLVTMCLIGWALCATIVLINWGFIESKLINDSPLLKQ